jgi:nucleoside-diphosphate-sugar epimerase
MAQGKPNVVITGIFGNLGQRLLDQLGDFSVIGVDFKDPVAPVPYRYEKIDLGQEESTRQLMLLLRETRPLALIHLAYVIDPLRTGVLALERMWQINVAGTARVMEAISEANRSEDCVEKFIFPSSVSAYGSDLARPATEDSRLGAHTLPYAIHKQESDDVVRSRAGSLRNCSVYILRPHIFAGASVENYLLGAFRGTPNGRSKRAAAMRAKGTRLPCVFPWGDRYLKNRIQFIHVDDMARLMVHLLGLHGPAQQRLTILNVAGRGEPLTFGRCVELAHAKLLRVPGKWAFRTILQFMWNFGLSAIPPAAWPYMTGEYIMDTSKLGAFLGDDYEKVIRFTIEEAFVDSFRTPAPPVEKNPDSLMAAKS